MRPLPGPLLAPLAITAEGLRLVLAVVSRGEFFSEAKERALHAMDGEPLKNARSAYTRGSVAVIPVSGPLFRHASMFTEISGASAYADIRKDLQRAVDDPSVDAILLDVNSPGGEVDGCQELASAIFAASEKKTVYAFAGGMAASAGYWIASAAEKIYCSETALLGSIGVRSAVVDASKWEENVGVKEIEIISSGSPGKRNTPVDEDVISRAQATVDALAGVFISHVARNRGVDEKTVLSNFGKGDVLVGAHAVAAGLADEIGDIEAVIQTLQSEAEMRKKAIAAEEPMEPKGEDMPEDEKKDAKAEDEEEEKDMKVMEEDEEKKDEKAALSALASKLGLSASASAREILAAANAGMVPASQVSAIVDAKLTERFEAEKKIREKEEAKARAKALADDASRGGFLGSKEDLEAFAVSNYAAAERLASKEIQKGRSLFERVTAGSSSRPVDPTPETEHGGVRVVKMGRPLAQAISDYRKANPSASYEQAASAVCKARPELAQSYLTGN